jgi:hypothetical protein
MPARAVVPVEAFPSIQRFRGHGPLLQGPHPRRMAHPRGDIRRAPHLFVLHAGSRSLGNNAIFASRFTFDAEWGPWQKVANKLAMSGPRVAINEAGEGIVA